MQIFSRNFAHEGTKPRLSLLTGKGRENVAMGAAADGRSRLFIFRKTPTFRRVSPNLSRCSRRRPSADGRRLLSKRARKPLLVPSSKARRTSSPDSARTGSFSSSTKPYCRYLGKRCNGIIGQRSRPVMQEEEQAQVSGSLHLLSPPTTPSLPSNTALSCRTERSAGSSGAIEPSSIASTGSSNIVGRPRRNGATDWAEEGHQAVRKDIFRTSSTICRKQTFAMDRDARVIAWNRAS